MIHNTRMSKWIPASDVVKSAGTWTTTYSTNKVFDRRTAADAAFNLFVTLDLFHNSADLQGTRLSSIDVFYNITTGAADDFATVELNKQSLSSVGAHTAAAVTTTIDAAHDTANERKATGEHKMTITLSTPEWCDDDELFVLYMVVDAAANTVFDLVGVRANFTFKA